MGIVYILVNPAMPGLVKIGFTAKFDAKERVGQLFTTGVPVPFEIAFACRSNLGVELERALHIAFGPYRVNPKREFFRIEPEQAIAILQLLHTEDATEEVRAQADDVDLESKVAGARLRSRRPTLNFLEMGLPVGTELVFVRGGEPAYVCSARSVTLRGLEMSLSSATRELLGNDYNVNPGPYWRVGSETLREIYERTYGEQP